MHHTCTYCLSLAYILTYVHTCVHMFSCLWPHSAPEVLEGQLYQENDRDRWPGEGEGRRREGRGLSAQCELFMSLSCLFTCTLCTGMMSLLTGACAMDKTSILRWSLSFTPLSLLLPLRKSTSLSTPRQFPHYIQLKRNRRTMSAYFRVMWPSCKWGYIVHSCYGELLASHPPCTQALLSKCVILF